MYNNCTLCTRSSSRDAHEHFYHLAGLYHWYKLCTTKLYHTIFVIPGTLRPNVITRTFIGPSKAKWAIAMRSYERKACIHDHTRVSYLMFIYCTTYIHVYSALDGGVPHNHCRDEEKKNENEYWFQSLSFVYKIY